MVTKSIVSPAGLPRDSKNSIQNIGFQPRKTFSDQRCSVCELLGATVLIFDMHLWAYLCVVH